MKASLGKIVVIFLGRVLPDGTTVPSPFDALASARNAPLAEAVKVQQNGRVLRPIMQDAWDKIQAFPPEQRDAELKKLETVELEVALTGISKKACVAAGMTGVSANDLDLLEWLMVE